MYSQRENQMRFCRVALLLIDAMPKVRYGSMHLEKVFTTGMILWNANGTVFFDGE